MTGQEAVDYIHSARGKGKKDGLRKITELMHRLGDPQDKLRYVHVVGTNGPHSGRVQDRNVHLAVYPRFPGADAD